jgi:hypothetical protein
MQKIILLITLFITFIAHDSHALVVTNECETCSYIDLNLNGYSYEDESVYLTGHLGGYGTSLTWVVPAGEYNFTGRCDSGESKGFLWIEFPVLTGSLLLDVLDLFCPDITTSTTTPSSTTTVPLVPCPLLELYGEHSEEVNYLRYVRDEFLRKNPAGRALIKFYYQISPSIIKVMREDKIFNEELREMIDSVLPILERELE